MTYLHHLVEEKDTTWRQPVRIIVMTPLKNKEEKEKNTLQNILGHNLYFTVQQVLREHELHTHISIKKCLTVIFR